jgi:hypothetical protein
MSDNELLQQISNDLKANTAQTVENAKQMALLTQAIMGNGVKGLNDRMCDMETWRDSHPRECQAPALAAKIQELEKAPGRAARNTLGEIRRTVLVLAIGAAVTLLGLGVYHYVETVPYNPTEVQGANQ